MTQTTATRTIRDSISGQPRTIQNPLLAKDVGVGVYIWYDGFTSVGRWDCPAIITRVDARKRRFRVRSLDDMHEQDEWYNFDVTERSSSSRQTMRIPSQKEVQIYLAAQKKRLEEAIKIKRESLTNSETALQVFLHELGKLKIELPA